MRSHGETTRATPATPPSPARRAWRTVAAGLLGVTMLGGCAQQRTAVWAWPPADASVRSSGTMPAAVGASGSEYATAGETESVSAGVSVFPSWGFADEPGPEAERLDSVLASRTTDALPGRLAWPSESRPDLRNQRVFRTSRDADSYRFPAQRRDRIRVRVILPAYPSVGPYPSYGPSHGPSYGPHHGHYRGPHHGSRPGW